MKYICLGYYDKSKHDAMTEAEKNAMFDECFEYDDYLRANGHVRFSEALQPPETALTSIGRTAKSPPRTVPMQKPRNKSAVLASLRRGT